MDKAKITFWIYFVFMFVLAFVIKLTKFLGNIYREILTCFVFPLSIILLSYFITYKIEKNWKRVLILSLGLLFYFVLVIIMIETTKVY
jgi:hypothetical protein